jgi:hypothetical protein
MNALWYLVAQWEFGFAAFLLYVSKAHLTTSKRFGHLRTGVSKI